MGGKKGAANLAHNHAAWIGAGSYDNINEHIAKLIGEEIAERRAERPVLPPYQPPIPTGIGQVLAGDIFEIKAFDQRFDICDFLDVYSQEYLALEATPHAADGEFVAACYQKACAHLGSEPTICTKTDRGGQFIKGLAGIAKHERIPPGQPWFNGECERGHRDCRALLMGVLSRMPRPKKNQELAAVQDACVEVRRLLNDVISKPSLGNVTPREMVEGLEDQVRAATAVYVEQQRTERRTRAADPRPLSERLKAILQLPGWPMERLLAFLRLRGRNYKFIEEG